MKNLKIGDTVYLISKKGKQENVPSTKILRAKVETFEYTHKGVKPVLRVIGDKHNTYPPDNYHIYSDPEKALESLKEMEKSN